MDSDGTGIGTRAHRGRRHRAPRSGRRGVVAALAVVTAAVGAGATAQRSAPGSQAARVAPRTAPTWPAPSITPSTPPSTAPSTPPSRTPSTPSSRAPSRTPPTAPAGTRLTGVYVTAYSWFDNTPPGSSAVSHPAVHRRAGGTGTYDDPVTVAVGHDRSTGRDVLDVPAGTRLYLPYLQRYLVVEDTCGDGPAPQDGPCHDLSQAPPGTTLWLDVWIGGAGGDPDAVAACADRLTGAGGRTAVRDPSRGLPVRAGPLYSGGCALP